MFDQFNKILFLITVLFYGLDNNVNIFFLYIYFNDQKNVVKWSLL